MSILKGKTKSTSIKEGFNPNVYAYTLLHEGLSSEYFKAIQVLNDTESDKLSEKQKQLLNNHKEVMEITATNVVLEGVCKGKSQEEMNEWKNNFLLLNVDTPENLNKRREKVDIGCPSCRSKLVFIDRRKVESSFDHVCCDEFQYVMAKDTFGCPNKDCFVHEAGLTWLEDGEGFYSNNYYVRSNDPRFIDRNSQPFRTVWRKIKAENSCLELLKIIIWNIYFYVSMTSKADENGKKHWNKRFKIQILNITLK